MWIPLARHDNPPTKLDSSHRSLTANSIGSCRIFSSRESLLAKYPASSAAHSPQPDAIPGAEMAPAFAAGETGDHVDYGYLHRRHPGGMQAETN